MTEVDRRALLTVTGLMAAAIGTSNAGSAEATSTPAAASSPRAAPPEVTRILAGYIVNAKYDDLPANVRKEGVRTLLNWVGVAIGARTTKPSILLFPRSRRFPVPRRRVCSAEASASTS